MRQRHHDHRLPTERTGLFRRPKVRSAAVEEARRNRWITLVVVVSVIGGIVLRFLPASPMWLDEAISASLAGEADRGWSHLAEALRHDGHPPLYYVLLALWTNVVGEGDAAVRSFSGALGVASLPLVWLVARRHLDRTGALLVLGVMASSPFAIRYSTEARMYLLILVLLLLGHLAIVRAWNSPSVGRLAGLSAVVAALLLTHYWSFFLVAVVGVGLLESGRRGARDRAFKLAGAVAAGCVAFIPWLPVFLDQLMHTGTPWSPAPRPTVVAALTLEAYGGGRGSEALLVAVVLCVLVVLGLGTRDASGGAVIGWTDRGWLRVAAGIGVMTMLLGAAVSLATDTAFQGRYGVFALVPVVLAAGLGLRRIPGGGAVVALSLLVLLSGISVARELSRDRTQVGVVAEAILEDGAGEDLVVFCPDQLAPAGYRLLSEHLTTLAYPMLDDGRRVDWSDYAERNGAVDVAEVADAIAERSDTGSVVWLVWMDGYETFDAQCGKLRLELAERLGHPTKVVRADGDAFDDAANLSRFPVAP